MKLKEIFDQLTYGELSQLSIGGGEQGEINEDNYPRILAHVNLGLTALYKRFPLKQSRMRVQLLPGVTTYYINSNYAASNLRSTQPVKYVQDTEAAPFTDDIHKIERVYTDYGFEFGLNNEADPYSIFTPTAHSLRVAESVANSSMDLPDELKTQGLDLVYRANHPIIILGNGYFDPSRIELELPYSHLEPLLLFVASRVHNPIGMQNEFNAGNNYAAKYEQSCQQLEQLNLNVDQGTQSTGITRNGWV